MFSFAPVLARGSEPRFPQLLVDHLTEEQRPIADKTLKVSSVGLAGPYTPLLCSPVLASRMYDLLDYLRWNSSLPPRLSEFAILIQGRLWRSQVESLAHYPQAIKAGLLETVAADLKVNRRPQGMKPDEAAIYDFCINISIKHEVSNDVYARGKAVLTDQQNVDLTALSGFYVTIAVLLSAAKEGVPLGMQAPFEPGMP